MISNLCGGQSIILDIASTENIQKWPRPSGERDLKTNHSKSIKIIIAIEYEFLDAQKTA